MQGRRFIKGVVSGGRLGAAKRRHRNNFGPPWQESRGRLRGEAYLERTSPSTSRGGGGGGWGGGWEVGILGQRRETPRWENDLVW